MPANLYPGGIPTDPYCLWCGVPLVEDRFQGDLYCGKTHRKKARRFREEQLDQPIVACYHPEKVPLTHRGIAIRWALHHDQGFYTCGCGVFHLTSRLNGHTMEALNQLKHECRRLGVQVKSWAYA